MPTTGHLILLIVAILLFAAGGVVSLARIRWDRERLRIGAKACLWAGVVLSLTTLIWHAAVRKVGNWMPLEDNFEAFLWLAILLALFVLYVQRTKPLAGLDWFVMPIVIVLLLLAVIFGKTKPQPYVDTTWSWMHRITSYGGAVAFVIAGAAGALYLLANRKLRSKGPPSGVKYGSLERLERITFSSVTLGFALLSVGLVTGIVYIVKAHGETRLGPNWLFSPKVLLTGAVWLVYAVVLHSPINPSFRGRKVAVLSIVGCLLMVGTLVAVQFMQGGQQMQRLLLLGLNHATAPLEVREKIAFSGDSRNRAIEQFRARFPTAELTLLSTCNRVELYTSREIHGHPRAQELIAFLAEFHSIDARHFEPHLYQKADNDVVNHLFAVTSSLDSMVLGESQILGQVREAYDAARELGAAGPLLNPLFQRAIAVGKEVQSSTTIGEGRMSVASVAVDYARRIFDHFNDKTVLCIGAGKMAALVLQSFAALQPKKMLICNRSEEKAIDLSQRFGGVAVPFDALNEHLIAADIVVSSTGATEPIITAQRVAGLRKAMRYRPIFIIDIAMPRDIEPAVGEIEKVYLYNIDDLQQVVAETIGQRKDSLDAARAIVTKHVEQFVSWNRARELGPVIEKLSQRYHALAAEELSRTLNKLPSISPAEKAHLEELTRRIVNKLLHDPIAMLRSSEGLHGATTQYLHALERLFHLDETDDGGPPG